MRTALLFTLLTSFIFLFAPQSNAQTEDEIQVALQHIIEAGLENGNIRVGDYYLFNPDTLSKYYIKRQFKPVWNDKINRADLMEILEGSYDEGLLPADYHLEDIKLRLSAINDGNVNAVVAAELDLLMTDAISLYINHMNFGKVSQAKIREDWELPASPLPENPARDFLQALKKHSLEEYSDEFAPQHFMYKYLKRGLKRYRAIAANGGWPQIPDGETLKKDQKSPRVSVMRERLKITGDFDGEDPEDPELFDQALEDAVKRFQFRHNLNQDGVAGKNTIQRMNVPVENRIDQIRINMERTRWVMHKLEKDFLVVNIAGFNMRRVTNNEIVYFSPVIVGKRYHESPIFKATMQYFVINPTWTVPYSIATKETLPKLQKDPGYLDQHNMIIMDRNGKKLDPYSIDFSQYSRSNFPFTVRQEAGPHNALGEVKFIFPNPHSVYVHDTPARGLFSKEDRAFSHGCIRLQNKWELLMSLMDDPKVWNMDKINEILASGKTTTVHLPKPIDIFILYWTAGADRNDHIYFDEDVYQRDAAVLSSLDKPWEYTSAR